MKLDGNPRAVASFVSRVLSDLTDAQRRNARLFCANQRLRQRVRAKKARRDPVQAEADLLPGSTVAKMKSCLRDGWTVAEIAHLFGASEGAVKLIVTPKDWSPS